MAPSPSRAGSQPLWLSRETLPVARRMAMAEAAGGRDLPPTRRTPGICRDFALMTCSALRERGVPARVMLAAVVKLSARPAATKTATDRSESARGTQAS